MKSTTAQPALHVAMLGHRGIPGNYGGFETFAEELATRMVKEGHRVDVYCRTNTGSYRAPTYKGVNLIHLSTVSNKHLDTIVHTLKSVMHACLVERPNVILMVNVGNTLLSWIPRVFGIPVVLNVDGLEWERKKWSWPAKAFLRVSASLTRWMPTAVVTDAKVIYDYYRERLGLKTTMIPYGASVVRKAAPDVLKKYGLRQNGYYLYVARFEPENNAHLVVKAYEQVRSDKPLVMIGDAPYATAYCKQVRTTKDKRIKFLGFVYGADYKALQQNAYAYVQGTEVGGTHPALIEAMGFGNCVLVNGTPENIETTNGSALPFWFFRGGNPVRGLVAKLQLVDDNPRLVQQYRRKAVDHIRRNYRWDNVSSQYLELFQSLCYEQPLVPVREPAVVASRRAKQAAARA